MRRLTPPAAHTDAVQQWSFSINDVHVQVSTHAEEPGIYTLRWTTDGREQSMTAAHADRTPMSRAQLQEAVRPLLAAATAPAPVPQRTTGLVREWRDDRGWGVIDSPQTPGGCWAHFSAVRVPGYASLAPGQQVVLEWEAPGQDGFDYRAVAAWPVGQERVDPVVDTTGGAYTSALHLTFDPPGPAPTT